ncbi:hypothetical protein GCM10020218_079610 [Dactylosporangium vinaceum]
MPGGGARRGRRDNGLVAQEYAVVGDVDPRVGEHLLEMLAEGGIAAYLQPASDLHPLTRTTTLPARPTDRLYVDREHLATAQDYLARLTTAVPEQPAPVESTAPVSDEDAFAAIVAGFHTTVDPTRAVPWPAAEDIVSSSTAAPDMDTEPAPRTSLRRPSDAVDRSLLDSLDTFGTDLPDEPEEDEGYTPPPPAAAPPGRAGHHPGRARAGRRAHPALLARPAAAGLADDALPGLRRGADRVRHACAAAAPR